METVVFTEQDFKQTFTGYVFIMKCADAENRKFGIEALQPDGSYKEIIVLTIAKNNTLKFMKSLSMAGLFSYDNHYVEIPSPS